ncbi:non-ribosomal peptide synthetase component F [Rhizobium pisi]
MQLPSHDRYDDLYHDFSWRIPAEFNIGRAVSDDWADRAPERVCLEHFSPDGHHRTMSYRALADRSSAFANALVSLGIERGDRVALLLPQSFETVIAHVAIYKMGAIALPLALLFGVEGAGIPAEGGRHGGHRHQWLRSGTYPADPRSPADTETCRQHRREK